MSYSGVDAGLILNLARQQGVGYQLPLKLHPPKFEIDPSYLTSVPVSWKHNREGITEECCSGGVCMVDHPSFASLRAYLEGVGFIRTERGWYNGDEVLVEFYLNGVLFGVGGRFVCASAMLGWLECGDNGSV